MPFIIKIVGFGNKKEILTSEIAQYIHRLKPYTTVSIEVFKTSSNKKYTSDQQLEYEGNRLFERWPDSCYPVALSEEGKTFTSISFSQWLANRLMQGVPLLVNIGSAYGLAPSLKQKCRDILSLSPLTFPHRLCYHILIEQVYRAFTILKSHPYHK